MLEGTRPIDLWMLAIELVILLVIVGEAAIGIRRYYKRRPILARLSKCMISGQALQNAVPVSGVQDNSLTTWSESVKAWVGETNTFLKKHSEGASSAFLQDRGGTSLRYGGVAWAVHDWYLTLLARLNNLRSIIEKPDVYF